PRRLFLLGDLDVLAAWSVATFAADRQLTRALHLPVLIGRRRIRRHEIETRGVTAHAFRLGKPANRKLVRFARDGQFRVIEPDPVLLLKISDLPRPRGLARPRIWIHRPTDRSREIKIARTAIAPDRADVIGLLPLSTDDQHHFVFLTIL